MDRFWLHQRTLSFACAAAGMLALAGNASAQESLSELQARLEANHRVLDELKAKLSPNDEIKLDPSAVQRIAEGVLKQRDEQKKAEEAAAKKKLEEKGYKVGTDLRMNARWEPTPGGGFVVETTNKDFTLHVGGHVQYDNVMFTESPNLKSSTQFGDLQDGTFFRRARFQFDGTFWEQFEFNMIYSLEQVREGIPSISEFYVGMKDIPWIGTVRAGHIRIPQGLEGDTSASSRSTTFMETSSATDAFSERFGTGLWFSNHYLDERATWSAMLYRQDLALHDPVGADFGDGDYAASGRLTALPIYEQDGACLLHLGISGTWRKAEKADPGLAGAGVVRFRARPEMRDSQGDFGSTVNGVTLPGSSARLVDTGTLTADSTGVLGTEFFAVNGPFSTMAEWYYVVANDVANAGVSGHQDRSFNGGYVQVGYFLTGEHRTYDRRTGRLSPSYLAGPTTNFWLTRSEDDNWSWGLGAWEVAARYSYLNLNDGPVRGGVLSGMTLGLNWFLNPNLKIEFNYIDENRYDVKPGTQSGVVQGFGTRVELGF